MNSMQCANCHHPHDSHSTLGIFKRHYKCRHVTMCQVSDHEVVEYVADARIKDTRGDHSPHSSQSDLPVIIIDYINDSFVADNALVKTNSKSIKCTRICDINCALCCCQECITTGNQITPNDNSDKPNEESRPLLSTSVSFKPARKIARCTRDGGPGCLSVFCYMVCCWLRRK